jgi:hypothetical protein
MIILLSPAKSLDETPHTSPVATTAPRFEAQTQAILARAKKLKPKQLAELMDISKALSDLNFARFQDFEAQTPMAAAHLFDGDVYDGLGARTLDADALGFAQTHLRILSGLYGLLRPLDAIRPYRLEMGTDLDIKKAKSLYAFWGAQIADQLTEDLTAQGDAIIINLASTEYAKAALIKGFAPTIITPRFLDIKDGKGRVLSFFAKRARGAMARYMIDKRITTPDGLKAFDTMGYGFDAALSSPTDWVFTRPQPEALTPQSPKRAKADH